MSKILNTGHFACQKLMKMNDSLNHDFCPWANEWVYWLKHPLVTVMLVIGASLACGLLVNSAVLGLTFMLVMVLILGTVWPLVAMRGVDCQISFRQQRVRVGQKIEVHVTLSNRWPWPLSGIHLKCRQMTNGDATGLVLASVRGWSTTEFVWVIDALERGLFPQETPWIETGFPFGLYHAKSELKTERKIIIWPETVPLIGLPDTSDDQFDGQSYSDRLVGDMGDLMGTRPFREGDSLRRVHWSQTARWGKLIVSERQAPKSTAITVIPQLDAQHHVVDHSHSSLETMIRLTASCCQHLHEQHGKVACWLGNKVHVCGQDELSFRQLMDALALIPKRGIDTGDETGYQRSMHPNLPQFKIQLLTDRHPEDRPNLYLSQKQIVILTNPHNHSSVNGMMTVPPGIAETEAFSKVWRKVCHVA